MTGLEGIPYCSVHRATATIHKYVQWHKSDSCVYRST